MSSGVHEDRPSVKFRLPARRGQDPVQLLHDSGFSSRPAVQHEDTWFERPQGAFLGSIVLRQVLPSGTWTMAWETTIRTGPEAERHHLWTEVDGKRMWARLERLGMNPVLTLKATRHPLDKGTQHLALERIKRMGDFLEVPQMAKENGLRSEVSEILRRLGATDPEPRSYRDLAMAAALPASA